MSADAYLQNILSREAVDTGPYSPARTVQGTLLATNAKLILDRRFTLVVGRISSVKGYADH
jgi:hypothetical protein